MTTPLEEGLKENGPFCTKVRGCLAMFVGFLFLCGSLVLGYVGESYFECEWLAKQAALQEVKTQTSCTIPTSDGFHFFACPLENTAEWSRQDLGRTVGNNVSTLTGFAVRMEEEEWTCSVGEDGGIELAWVPTKLNVPNFTIRCSETILICFKVELFKKAVCDGRKPDETGENLSFSPNLMTAGYVIPDELAQAMVVDAPFRIVAEDYKSGCDVSQPNLGCRRVRYSILDVDEITVLARSQGGELVRQKDYAEACPASEGFFTAMSGEATVPELLGTTVEDRGQALLEIWLLRGGAVLAATIGAFGILRPLATMYDISGSVLDRCGCLKFCMEKDKEDGIIESFIMMLSLMAGVGVAALGIGVGAFLSDTLFALAALAVAPACLGSAFMLGRARQRPDEEEAIDLTKLEPQQRKMTQPMMQQAGQQQPMGAADQAMNSMQETRQQQLQHQQQAQQQMGNPTAPDPTASTASTAVLFRLACPPGVLPGGMLSVTTPDGREVTVQLPDGITEGQEFQVYA